MGGDHSPNISRAASVTGSDMGDDIDDNESIDGGHGRIINDPTAYYSLSSPVYRPSSPTYSSSPTLSFTPPRPAQSDFNSFVSTYQNPTLFRVPGPNNVINPAAPQCVLDKDGNRIIVDEVDNDGQFFSSTPVLRSRSNSVSSRDSSSLT